MAAGARETRLSETTYVQSATQDGADYRNRIFSTFGELPFAGHPSLGTAFAVARARGESSARYVQQTHAGLQPVEVQRDGDAGRASMLQEPAWFGPEVSVADALGTAGLPPCAAHPELPPQAVSTGVAHLMVCVRDHGALAAAAPTAAALRALLEPLGAVVLYLAAVDPAAGTARARGFFADTGGVVEDPGTGSAAGTLCAYLHARTRAAALIVEQGVEMGRPSRIDCELAGERVRVAGDVVVVGEGRVLV